MFSCEFCEIFQNTFFYRTPPGDCFCIMHFRRCTFNLFNNPCLERKGNQWNCMFKQFVFMSIFRNISHTYIGFNINYNLFIINLFSSYFWTSTLTKLNLPLHHRNFSETFPSITFSSLALTVSHPETICEQRFQLGVFAIFPQYQ